MLLNLDKEILPQQEADDTVGSEWLGSCSEFLGANGVDSSLSYLCRRVYDIECNWKVTVLDLLLWLKSSQGPFILFCLLVNHVMLMPINFEWDSHCAKRMLSLSAPDHDSFIHCRRNGFDVFSIRTKPCRIQWPS